MNSESCIISEAVSDEDLHRCFPVMQELRPHLKASEFVDRVRRQQDRHGYRLIYLESAGQVRSLAGFRSAEFLAWGRILYVDDLITTESARARGGAQRLFDWLIDEARRLDCDELHLDSGVQRFAAHRFYLKNRMEISSHHFGLRLR